MGNSWIPADDWQAIVEHTPIVSVDLLILQQDGILLGKRKNKPAKGFWFVPGGRVHKGETRHEAVHRIAKEELGIEVEIIESLGAYEHLYQTSDVGDDTSKHYLANGYVVNPIESELKTDNQHSELRTFQQPPEELHEYVANYIRDTQHLNWDV